MPVASLDDIRSRIGDELGVSDWIEIGQDRISDFAEATEDRQFIHVDQETAGQTPFGGTIAHGFLTLSLLSRMAADAMLAKRRKGARSCSTSGSGEGAPGGDGGDARSGRAVSAIAMFTGAGWLFDRIPSVAQGRAPGSLPGELRSRAVPRFRPAGV